VCIAGRRGVEGNLVCVCVCVCARARARVAELCRVICETRKLKGKKSMQKEIKYFCVCDWCGTNY
jgi:hypothetical protein